MIPRVASLKTAAAFRAHLIHSRIPLEFDDALTTPWPLAQPLIVDGTRVGNRFCILPMEGWDGTTDGRPAELTIRRWQHFGLSGSNLIGGGEAAAVRHDGRATPNQLVLTEDTLADLTALREALVAEHHHQFA